MRRHRRAVPAHAQGVELNVIPLIDVVFFLLIFYVVSTTMLREQAVPVQRPASGGAQPVQGAYVAVAVLADGTLQVDGRPVEAAGLTAAVGGALAAAQAGSVLVVPDRSLPTGDLLRVMDACSAAGAAAVSVAATREP